MGYREMFGIMFTDIEYIRSKEDIERYNKTTKGPRIGEEHPLLVFPSDDKLEIKFQSVHPMIKLPAEGGHKIAKRSFLFLKDSCFGSNRTLADPLKYVSLAQLTDRPCESVSHTPAFKRPRTC